MREALADELLDDTHTDDDAARAIDPDEAPFDYGTWIESEGTDTDGDRWEIQTLDDAHFAMQLVAELDTQIEANKSRAARKIRRYTEWLTRANGPLQRARDRMDLRLQQHALAARKASKDSTKTFTFPFGVIRTTGSETPRVDVEDKKAFLEWIHENMPDLIWEIASHDVLLTGMRDHFAPRKADDGTFSVVNADGQIPAGLIVTIPEITAKVTPQI